MRTEAVALMLVGLAVVASGRSRVDFTGTWVLDVTKSNLGNGGGEVQSTILNVQQEGNRLSILEVIGRKDGKTLACRNLVLDHAVPARAGMDLVSARHAGRSIRIRSTQERHLISLEEWRMSGDSAKLLITIKRPHSVQRLVFKYAQSAPE